MKSWRKRADESQFDLGLVQKSSEVLRTHIAMIQGERQMLRLRRAALQHQQQLLEQDEKRIRDARLQSREAQFHRLVESFPCQICQFDQQQRFRYCNKAFGSFFEASPRKVLGKYVWEVIGEARYDAMRPGIVRALQGEEATYELSFEAQNGHDFYCRFVPERIADDTVIGFFIMLLDISDRKAIERKLWDSERMFRKLASERAKLLRVQDRLIA